MLLTATKAAFFGVGASWSNQRTNTYDLLLHRLFHGCFYLRMFVGLSSLMKTPLFILALTIMPAGAQSQVSKTLAVMPSVTSDRIANAIFRAEGTHSKHPYGVMIPCTSPRVVCINTIQHAWRDFEGESRDIDYMKTSIHVIGSSVRVTENMAVSLPFIQFLGTRYCPPSVDFVGYRNWTNNVWRIYEKSISNK